MIYVSGTGGWIELVALLVVLVGLAALLVFRVVWKIRQMIRFARLVDQLHVQLAGCSVAAMGGTSNGQVATPEMFGWSPAYQDVLNLRHRHDVLHDVVLAAAQHWANCGCDVVIDADGTMRTNCVHERAHRVMATHLFRGVTIAHEDLPGARFAGT